MRELLARAAELWAGLPDCQLTAAITATLEGHLRNIVCRLTVEELHCWRARAAKLLAQEVAPDLARKESILSKARVL